MDDLSARQTYLEVERYVTGHRKAVTVTVFYGYAPDPYSRRKHRLASRF
jgi:hypothetical protein